jgi:hypothetical protein
MVVALVALFVSLGGVSYGLAAGSIGSREIRDASIQGRDIRAGAVHGRHIKDGTIRSRDVKDGAIRGEDIRNGTILSRDVKDGSLRGIDIKDRTLTGATIATGAIGTRAIGDGAIRGRDVGANALGDREIDETQLDIRRLAGVAASRYVKNVTRVVGATASDTSTPKVAPPAVCPRRKRLLGGGARIVSAGVPPVALNSSGPSGNAWAAAAYATAPTPGGWQLESIAICG